MILRRQLLLGPALASTARAETPGATRVVASFPILADMVRQIAGDAASVTGLVPPDGDPRTHEPRPGNLRAAAAA